VSDMAIVQTFSEDISSLFDFEENSLDYVDAPLAGWLTSRDTGERFAFRCLSVLSNRIWHWSLVSASAATVDEAFNLSEADSREWLSILEDRRGDGVILSIAKIAPVEKAL